MDTHRRGMSRITLIAIVAILMVAAILAFLYFQSQKKPAFYIDASDRELSSRGALIYVQHCAACHGAKLEGQENWRTRLGNGRLPAPPHDESGHTWHHPDVVLFDIVKNGLVPGRTAPPGHESDMPAYGEVLSDTEIAAVLAYIKSSWSREVREVQEDVSRRHQQR